MYKSISEVRRAHEKGEGLQYLFFWGHVPSKDGKTNISCLSQWYPSVFVINDITYSNCEQYMMASKAKLFGDEEVFEEIINNIDPKTVKALGRKVKNFNEKIWKEQRVNIVTEGNIAKFQQNEEMRDFLKSTKGKILVEASPYDRIWGIGMGKTDQNILNPNKWRGENLLGFSLMEVRKRVSKLKD